MTRLRSAAQRAPQTTKQAVALLTRFSVLDGEIAGHEADRAAAIAATNAAVDALVVPKVAELKDIAKQLKTWWAVARDELTGGKRKSIELGGCVIGYRVSPPKVHFTGGNDDAAVAVLVASKFRRLLVRTKRSPDKPAILKLLGIKDRLSARLESLGFSARQSEDFFVDRLPSRAVQAGDVVDAAVA